MTTEEKTLLAVLTTAAVLVPIALGAALGWPAWSWLLIAVPLLGALGLVARNIRRRVQQELLWQQVAPPVQVEPQHEAMQTLVADVPLPSAVADYDFHFSATADWRPVEGSTIQHANFGGLATDAILARARSITAAEQPNKVEVVQHRLVSELGMVRTDASGGVEVWADHVQLTLPEADRERLRRRSEVCKDEDLWERELDHERRKRDYLRDDVLKSMGSAVTWWLARKDNDVEDTVRLIDPLAQLCAAANHAEVPELFPSGSFHDGSRQTTWFPSAGLAATPFSNARPVVSRVGALMDTLDVLDNRRALFARHLARLIEKFGKTDEAQEIRGHFDAPRIDKESADLPESNGNLPDPPAPDAESPPREKPPRNSPPPGESEQFDEPRDSSE